MKQRLYILAALIFLMAAVIGLNVASYSQKDTLPDSEMYAKRSTYNAGATGTRAFYELLAESNKNVSRRQTSLLTIADEQNSPDTLVLVGDTLLPVTDKETEAVFRWISNGGRLVLIDRNPPSELLITTANWKISVVESNSSLYNVDPSDQRQMTDKTAAAKPVQPSVFNRNIISVQPSRFASTLSLDYFGGSTAPQESPAKKITIQTKTDSVTSSKPVVVERGIPSPDDENYGEEDDTQSVALDAPFVHLANDNKRILVDFPFGEGKIIWLTDPYIVSNAGIGIVDNLQLALNIVGNQGTIAFDEHHHGYGEGQSRLLTYFSETPVMPIAAQLGLLIILLLVSQSRRFARALPEIVPSRISKLEYVSAFAELQQRTKAYDLAIENIYGDFRRKAARLCGADNFTISRKELSEKIAERGAFNSLEIYNLMRRCEEIIQGDKTNKAEILRLTKEIRKIEEKLNMKKTRLSIRG